MDARLCVGKYAALPYSFEGFGIKVYCAEELCYVLKENAFLLDAEIMSDRLVDWLERECALTELAKELYRMVHRKGSFSEFVGEILRYTGFYDDAVIEQAVSALKKGVGLSGLEKRKMRIDALVEQHKFMAAVREYDALLSSFAGANGSGTSLYAAVLHNRGKAFAGLMYYEEAAGSFLKAYETDQDPESLKCYLAAKRLLLEDGDYVGLISSSPEYSETALLLEREFKELDEDWRQGTDFQRLLERRKMRNEDPDGYQRENRRILLALKEDYRGNNVS